MDFIELQSNLNVWLAHNFPNTTSDQQLKGVMEEVSELIEAERDLLDMYTDENIKKTEDAVGDVIVYLCNYCNMKEIDFAMCVFNNLSGKEVSSGDVRNLMLSIGKICHADLKWEQGIRGYDRQKALSEIMPAISEMYRTLDCYCAAFSINITDCIHTAYDAIMKRDWINNPITG